MKISVIGDGGWGTALAMLLNRNGHAVTVWCPFSETMRTIGETGQNKVYLPGIDLPSGILWTDDRARAVADAEVVALAIPTRFFAQVMQTFAPCIPSSSLLVSVAKGFDPASRQRMSVVAETILQREEVGVLSGPSHAEEVARETPTAVVVASRSRALALQLQKVFAGPRFRVYTSSDVIGIELGAALKNVIAVAVGVADGLGFGDNTRAALITRGLAEMTRLGRALGARPSTFSGLGGMGDLIVTCTSRHSRNRSVGEEIGKGRDPQEIMHGMKQVAEGIWNCSMALAIAREQHVDAPIAEEVHAIVHEGKNPKDAVVDLLTRDLKPED